nr:DoxX family protein [uncultured Flavobacterium sp.]
MLKKFPFLTTKQFVATLRIAVALFLIAHGCIRIYAGTVGDFGDFLNSKGFIIGDILAWTITIFELVGGTLLILNRFKKIISLFFIFQLIMGVVLVHAANGWFVVGYQSGGMEYSALLILCLLLIASEE